MTDETIAAVREALEDRGVLVFPRMNLTDAEQLAFTDKLGKRLNYTRKAPGSGVDGEEDVYAITLDKKVNTQPEYVLGTFFWHIDGVTINQPSAQGNAAQCPQALAHWRPDRVRQHVCRLRKPARGGKEGARPAKGHSQDGGRACVPVFEAIAEEDLARWRGMSEVMAHPLVWTHNSGRKSLVIGSHADGVVGAADSPRQVAAGAAPGMGSPACLLLPPRMAGR